MIIYLIHQIGYLYNDEYYCYPEQSCCEGTPGYPVIAYKNKEKAEAICAKLNEETKLFRPLDDGDGNIRDKYYQVVPTEIED